MRRRLLAGFLAFAAVVVVLLEVPLGISLASNARATAISEIENDGASLGLIVGASLASGDVADAQAVIDHYATAENAIVVVVSNGKLELAAGAGAGEEMADRSTRLILKSAELGRTAGEEGSRDPDDDLLYAAVPVSLQPAGTSHARGSGPGTERVAVVLLVAASAAPLHAHIRRIWLELALFGAAMLAVAAAVGTLLARSLTKPLATIEAAVVGLGAGNLSERVPRTGGPAELHALGDTVNGMADRIEELLRTQRAFVADASHQLRTPMTALRLRLENLEGTLPPDRAGDLAAVMAEADRLSRLVDGLLELARAPTALDRPRVRVDLAEALPARVEAWRAFAEERGVSLIGEPDPGLRAERERGPDAGPARSGDAERTPSAGIEPVPICALACPGHVEQMLDNLLANALEVTPPGGRVVLGLERVGDDIELHVVDDGPGMTAAERARAFDRFWRPEGATHEGSGLGLAIVAQLVRMSGGTTWLDAANSGGVDAVVRLQGA